MSVQSNAAVSVATTSSYGVTVLIDSISSTSVVAAPTANAVNTAIAASTQKATLTAKGDIYAATASATPTNVAVGTSLQSLIPDSAQQLLLKGLTDKLGLSSTGALGLVGSLAPLLLKFLNLGASSQGVGSNPILTTFLDSNHDGNVDLGDALKFAGRFLSR
jgi:hypothetical protein